MSVITDKTPVSGGIDYTFVCSKVPFTICCSSSNNLHHGPHNYIDLDLVNQMRIPLKKIKVRRLNYLGENLRSVGHISQTIQCVVQGVSQGTVHLTATVVRNLFTNFNVDCIASAKTFRRLTGKDPPKHPDDEGYEDDAVSPVLCLDEEEEEEDAFEEVKVDDHVADSPDPSGSPVPSKARSTRTSSSPVPSKARSSRTPSSPVSSRARSSRTPSSPVTSMARSSSPCSPSTTSASFNPGTMTLAGPNLLSFGTQGEKDEKWDKVEEEVSDVDKEEDELARLDLVCDACFRGGLPYRVASTHVARTPACPSLTPDMIKYWSEHPEEARKMEFQVDMMMIENKYKIKKKDERGEKVAQARR